MDNLALKYSTMSNRNRTALSDKVRVCFYGRVSTQHEAQMSALKNQMQWYDNILDSHPNWEKVDIYVDRGVTGTQATKRPGFMNMIEDASKGTFDLICTREVSRFARNTVDTLAYTRELSRLGVEVFFCNDNIWSFDTDGEMRLTIMAAISQDEVRHISERVRAGQFISRQKGVLYGNGNILGYKLVKGEKSSDNTYEIIEDEAETIRMIYDFYLEGMGVKTIAGKLQKLHRKNAVSTCNWDAPKVLRVLDNKTYAGYVGYNKSYTSNFLEHTRIVERDRSKYEYVKGNFPAIIPEDIWNKVQMLKGKKVTHLEKGIVGKKISKDRWTRVLVCECGKSYAKMKWRTNSTGEDCNGYQCYNQRNNGRKSIRLEHGLSVDGYCNIPSICEWKLDFMLKSILHKIWLNPKLTVTTLVNSIAENFTKEQVFGNTELGKLQRESERLKCRLERLLDSWLDSQLDKTMFEAKKKEIEGRISDIDSKLQQFARYEAVETVEDVSSIIKRVTKVLENACELEQKWLSDKLVDLLVECVVPTEAGVFKWYLNCSEEDKVFACEDYILYDTFSLKFDEARTYRKSFGNFIRKNQWTDLQIEVYVRS